jgi:hypothetical protein
LIKVTLTPDEIHLAASHAVLRRSRKQHRSDRAQNGASSWDNEIQGSLAELAWCKHRNIYWSGVSDIHAKDGGNIEVRWTHHTHNGGLIIYPNDGDQDIFVLAEGYAPTIYFVGWIHGGPAKQMATIRGNISIVDRSKLRKIH